jgi:hypothetical protein
VRQVGDLAVLQPEISTLTNTICNFVTPEKKSQESLIRNRLNSNTAPDRFSIPLDKYPRNMLTRLFMMEIFGLCITFLLAHIALHGQSSFLTLDSKIYFYNFSYLAPLLTRIFFSPVGVFATTSSTTSRPRGVTVSVSHELPLPSIPANPFEFVDDWSLTPLETMLANVTASGPPSPLLPLPFLCLTKPWVL